MRPIELMQPFAVGCVLCAPAPSRCPSDGPGERLHARADRRGTIIDKPDAQVPLDLQFSDESGKP